MEIPVCLGDKHVSGCKSWNGRCMLVRLRGRVPRIECWAWAQKYLSRDRPRKGALLLIIQFTASKIIYMSAAPPPYSLPRGISQCNLLFRVLRYAIVDEVERTFSSALHWSVWLERRLRVFSLGILIFTHDMSNSANNAERPLYVYSRQWRYLSDRDEEFEW